MSLALTRLERARVRQHFTAYLCTHSHVRIYWIPERRDISARTVAATRAFRLPDGAQLVGTYSHPFPSEDFLGDLDDLLEKLRVQHAADGDADDLAVA